VNPLHRIDDDLGHPRPSWREALTFAFMVVVGLFVFLAMTVREVNL
jgi:hypothetical protein